MAELEIAEFFQTCRQRVLVELARWAPVAKTDLIS
jgi:hypothetical protein